MQSNSKRFPLSASPVKDSKDEKIKVNCVLTTSLNNFNLEVNKQTSIRSLKRKISDQLSKSKSKSSSHLFNLLYKEKDLTNFNGLKISDLFTRSASKECQNKRHFNDSNSEGLIDNQSPMKIQIIPKEDKSCISTETKVKYMLECQNHLNENAHYYCFECSMSFCSLCIEEHSTHDFLDKYDYSKSNKEIVNNILHKFIMTIRENANDDDVISNCLIKKEKFNYVNQNEKIVNVLSELKKTYDDYMKEVRVRINSKINEKIDDFKENMEKFKILCLNNLNISKKQNIADVIVLDDEYFKNIYSTVKELNKGKQALIKYLNARNDEIKSLMGEYRNFDKEIQNDIINIINKIKAKYTVQNEINNSIQTIYESDYSRTLKIDDINKDFKVNDFRIEINNNNNTHQYIMKRRLPNEIILYDIKTKKIYYKKDFKRDKTQFKKFLHFSVFISVGNNLYISGGKTKDDKCISDFYLYSSDSNELSILPNMLNERCSHSMIYITNNFIKNEIFAIGGYNINTCERYNIQNKTWKLLPRLNIKERQVSTLFLYNEKFLYSFLGFINNNYESKDYCERLSLDKLNQWDIIEIKHSLGKYALKKFNVGIIRLNGEFILLGGEHVKENESNSVWSMKVIKDKKNEVIEIEDKKIQMPIKCSFINKEFIMLKEGKYAQFEMKKNNLVFYDVKKNKIKVKSL